MSQVREGAAARGGDEAERIQREEYDRRSRDREAEPFEVLRARTLRGEAAAAANAHAEFAIEALEPLAEVGEHLTIREDESKRECRREDRDPARASIARREHAHRQGDDQRSEADVFSRDRKPRRHAEQHRAATAFR